MTRFGGGVTTLVHTQPCVEDCGDADWHHHQSGLGNVDWRYAASAAVTATSSDDSSACGHVHAGKFLSAAIAGLATHIATRWNAFRNAL
jgi:hypothetical protein